MLAYRHARVAKRLVQYTLLIVLAVVMVMPFIWMVSTSLKSLPQVFVYPPQWIPAPAVWSNWIEIWLVRPFARYFFNSFVMIAGIILGQLVVGSLAAYAFARLKFPGRNALFILVLAMLMVPSEVRIIPLYLMASRLNIINTYIALIIPDVFSALAIFLLRQYFLTIPRDLDESAIMDGANHAVILTRLIIPMSMPVLATLTVFISMGSWNALLWPLIVTNSDNMRVVAVALAAFSDLYGTNYPMMMTASMYVTLPTLLLYIMAQRLIVRGVTLSGLKG